MKMNQDMDKIKVLLVEDEQTLAMIIKDTLEGQNFIIHTAADGDFFHHLYVCSFL